jgi:uncharacterized protein YyaL (SSP411 family)
MKMPTRDGHVDIPDLSTLPPDGGAEFNRLIFTSSPYLLQHARNPVDWYPWGAEAFDRAAREDKPVFLSIGYSTCHWCHVMEHESFEDAEVAAFLNEHFVSIKVDREERPDVDHIYMSVCQAMMGSGGWPLTIFMTPAQMPFYAGTYFPKTDRFGRPGFLRVLEALANVWRNERHKATGIGEQIRASLEASGGTAPSTMGGDVLTRAVRSFAASYDGTHGGFSVAPKFPIPHALSFLLRLHNRTGDAETLRMVEHTLRSMHRGGIYDHVGYGFCRYSTDEKWLVPHFEKMLYDNALLAMAYSDAFLVTKDEAHADVLRQIFTYIERDMTSPDGAFYSAENADSEGEEGKFYVFTQREFMAIAAGDHADALAEYFGATAEGNFEHASNVLHIAVDPEDWRARHGFSTEQASTLLEQTRTALFTARAERIHPSLDDKVLTSWNGLMIAALAKAGAALGEDRYIRTATRAADFLLATMRSSDGRLLHRSRNGDTGIDGFLEDYAYFVWGLIELYQACFDARYLEAAVELTGRMLDDFRDEAHGGLFFTAHNSEQLIARTKEAYDGATPSGNSVAAFNLIRLSHLTGNTRFEQVTDEILRTFGDQASRHPGSHAMMLSALDIAIGPSQEIVVAAADRADAGEMLRTLHSTFLPRAVLLYHAQGPEGDALRGIVPFVGAQRSGSEQTAAFVCSNTVCAAPVHDAAALRDLLSRSAGNARVSFPDLR